MKQRHGKPYFRRLSPGRKITKKEIKVLATCRLWLRKNADSISTAILLDAVRELYGEQLLPVAADGCLCAPANDPAGAPEVTAGWICTACGKRRSANFANYQRIKSTMEPAEVDKIKAVNLLPITENLRAYILELFPEHKPMVDAGFDYVRFFRGAIYFYSKAYLDSKTLDELLVAFGKAVDFGTPGFQIQQDKAKSRGIGV